MMKRLSIIISKAGLRLGIAVVLAVLVALFLAWAIPARSQQVSGTVFNPFALLDTGAIQLTQAQIFALNTVPVQLIAAPSSATQFILPLSMTFNFTFGTGKYTPTNAGADLADLRASYGCTVTTGWLTIQSTQAVPKLLTESSSKMLLFPVSKVSSQGVVIVSSPFDYNTFAPSGVLQQPLCLNANHSFNTGPISTATVATKGTLYVVGDTGTVDVGKAARDSGDATYVVDSVDGGGGVLTLHFPVSGATYPVTDSNAEDGPYVTATGGAQPGVGTGLTLNVTAVSPVGDGTMTVDLQYGIVGK